MVFDSLRRVFNKITFLEYRRKRRREQRNRKDKKVARKITERHKSQVLAGPFKGLEYSSLVASGSGLSPKIIGSYEKEVHLFLEKLIRGNHQKIINIGCGEGFYAVGMALRMPQTHVFAFDINEDARLICNELAQSNGVKDQITIKGECQIEELDRLTSSPAIIICDCEGEELNLLKPEKAPGLKKCPILVEIHEVDPNRNMAATILSRFKDTHEAELRNFCERDVSSYAPINFLPVSEQKFAVDENRSKGLQWALLTPGKYANQALSPHFSPLHIGDST